MKLSTIHSTLASRGLQPTRSLGQNFLHDQNLAEWTVSLLHLEAGEPWVEIGPGLGALTEYALLRSDNGLLIEKDDRLIPYLHETFPRLKIVHGDAAAFDTRDLFERGPVKVLGNLPYYISSQILFNFTSEPSPATAIVATLQRELAERLAAAPGSKDYGGPTVLIGRRWRTQLLRMLPASVFTPAPQVESAVVLLTPRPPGELPDCDSARFERLVKLGFSQRRKQLRKMIASEIPEWSEAAARLKVPETARAEELTVLQWIALANFKPGDSGDSCSADLAAKAQDLHGEQFDVVDSEDRVISQASRHTVHSEKLRHRAVHIFVYNSRGEIFLQKRSRWKDVHPLRWDSSAAGHVNAGDDYNNTARREVEEELGVPPTELLLVAAIEACEQTGWEFVKVYKTFHEGPFRLPPAEIETGGWFTPAQVESWTSKRPEDFASGFLACWKAASRRKRSVE